MQWYHTEVSCETQQLQIVTFFKPLIVTKNMRQGREKLQKPFLTSTIVILAPVHTLKSQCSISAKFTGNVSQSPFSGGEYLS
jgi:hypothetical protein